MGGGRPLLVSPKFTKTPATRGFDWARPHAPLARSLGPLTLIGLWSLPGLGPRCLYALEPRGRSVRFVHELLSEGSSPCGHFLHPATSKISTHATEILHTSPQMFRFLLAALMVASGDALRVATVAPRTSAISMGLSVGDKFPDSALKVTHAACTMSSRLRTRCLQPQLLKLTRP